MKRIYIYILFAICARIYNLHASEYDGYKLIRQDYYEDALNVFRDSAFSSPTIRELGEQYCYLKMNNINFDRDRTLKLIFDKNIPDSIFCWVAEDMKDYLRNDSCKIVFIEKVLADKRSNTYTNFEKFSLYLSLVSACERMKDYAKCIVYYAEKMKYSNSERSIADCNYYIRKYCQELNDSIFWREHEQYCFNNGITIDTLYKPREISMAGLSKMTGSPSKKKSGASYSYGWDRASLKYSHTRRDSLAVKAQMKHVSFSERKEIYLEMARYDSIHYPSQNNYIGKGYSYQMIKLADLCNEEGKLDEEEYYLNMAYKGFLLKPSLKNIERQITTLVQLVDNAICQKKYNQALKYEKEIGDSYYKVYGINEDTYFENLNRFDDRYIYGILASWSDILFKYKEHIVREASILCLKEAYAEANKKCLLADSIVNSYNRWRKLYIWQNKYDIDIMYVKSMCAYKQGDSQEAYAIMDSALNLNNDYYWNGAVLTKNRGFLGGRIVYTNEDRLWLIERYAKERDLIYRSTYHLNSEEFSNLAYNQCLSEKNILLETSNIINKLAIAYNNEHYFNIKALKGVLDKSTNIFVTDSLQKEIANEEKALVYEMSLILDSLGIKIFCNSEDVKSRLLPNHVAIEYMVAPLNEDSTMYCALLLRNNSKYPEMIPLFEEKEVLSLVNTLSENQTSHTYSFDGNGEQLSNLVWSKILPHIKPGETIYFAPSGLLHQVAIEALPYDENHTMADIFNLVRLSSTREIVSNKSSDMHTTATLYGGIKYDMSGEEILAESELYSSTTLLASRGIENDTLDRGNVKYLPGTKREVENINQMLKDNKLSVQLFTTTNANEESFKALSGKHQNILHIATHGFYWSDSTAQKKDYFSQRMRMMDDKAPAPPSINPLNRCGLLFAGANTALSGHSADLPEGVQDGILTAKEISLLDLRDADLVVLSACETGKGEITGEGVFGLQRAFKQAGAQTIIMSLWPVNDAATQLLMTEFYHNWITNHQSKREAFRNAQNTVRSQYEEPVYWAGFIMLD